jgi:hypothetical protein
LVPKKDGGLHMCIDYHAVNRMIRKNRSPLLHIEELVKPLGGSTCFSKINLASGYHQILYVPLIVNKRHSQPNMGCTNLLDLPTHVVNLCELRTAYSLPTLNYVNLWLFTMTI